MEMTFEDDLGQNACEFVALISVQAVDRRMLRRCEVERWREVRKKKGKKKKGVYESQSQCLPCMLSCPLVSAELNSERSIVLHLGTRNQYPR
jgi:hypothetical protein